MLKAALVQCLLASCAIAGTVSTAPLSDWEKPTFCKDRDCPRFETVEKADGYETRKYEEALWAWIEFEDVRDPQEATLVGVAELVNYLGGNNSDSKQIEMGTPLARNFSVYEGKHSHGMASALGRRRRRQHMDMTVKAYLPYSCQDGKEQPPKPSSERVHVDKFPAWTSHVRSFDGWPTAANFRKHANRLMKYLEEDDKDFLEDWFVCSIYDPPTTLYDRHNKVLLSAEAGRRKERRRETRKGSLV